MFNGRLWKMVSGSRRYVFACVGFQWLSLLANIALVTFVGVFLQSLLDGDADAAAFVQLALGGVLAIATRAACTVMAQRMSLRSSQEAKRLIRQQVYGKLVAVGPSYVEHVRSSEAMQVCVEGVEQLEVYFGQYLPQLFYALAAPVTLFCCLAPLCLPAAAALIVCVPLIPASIMAIQRIAKKVMGRYMGAYTDLGALFLENIQGLTTLKIYEADAARHKQMNDEAESFRKATMNVLRMQLNSIIVMDVFAYGGAAIGIVVALTQYAAGAAALAGAFAVVLLSADFFLPMRTLGSFFHTAMNGLAAAEKMFAILDAPLPAQGTRDLPSGTLDVRCADLGYSFDGTRQVLSDVEFTARPGELTAVVGASGSGKSTLAGVICGRNAAFTGEVRVGGIDVRDLAHAALARGVTVVSYASQLFKGTVRDNLLMGRPAATEDAMWDALAKVRLDAFVRASGGLDMAISEDASNLSGGQRQRLALARALLHDSPVYVFDEATSNVDAASEAAIWDVIGELAHTKTVIAIAHRLSVITCAARIYVMEAGSVAESGTHEELLAATGTYARMWEEQARLEAYAQAGSGHDASEAGGANQAPVDASVAQVTRRATIATQGDECVADATDGISAPTKAPARKPLAVMRRLVGLVRPLAPYMALAVTLGCLGHLAAVFLTLFGAQGIATSAGQATPLGFGALLAGVVTCGLARGPLHYGEQLSNHYIAFKLLAIIRDRMFSALRRLAPAKLEGRDKGGLVSTLTADIELLEVFYAHTISPALIAVIVSLAMALFITCQSPMLGFVALVAYACVGIAVPWAASRATGRCGMQMRNLVGDMNSYVLESLRGLTETLQFGQAETRSAELSQRAADMAATEERLKGRTSAFMAATTGIVMLADVIMLLSAGALVTSGSIGFAQALTATVALMSSFGPVIAVANLGSTLAQTIASGNRVLDILDETPEVSEVTSGEDVTFKQEGAHDVSFAYGGEDVLRDVSLEVKPGTMTCITGRSGSGKSTLLKLLMRFWDPTRGYVEMSGVNLRRVNTRSLRSAQSYMTQETHLFSGTIAENILLARPDATREELERACEKAALLDFVQSLPQGFDTQVGELGGALSGGERQRIGLARVFLHDAPLVLLDEPTSNLDSLNEAAVLSALEREREGKTIVLVSHRRSTTAFADTFVSVENGRLS